LAKPVPGKRPSIGVWSWLADRGGQSSSDAGIRTGLSLQKACLINAAVIAALRGSHESANQAAAGCNMRPPADAVIRSRQLITMVAMESRRARRITSPRL
jgi:hypothetical protein